MPTLSVVSLMSRRGIVVSRSDTSIEGICFRDGFAITGNGSGIWHDGGNLTIRNCRFYGNQNGVLVARSSNLEIARSVFDANGAGCGHTHAVYLNSVGCARVLDSVFRDTLVGHHLKSRAEMIEVLGCYFGGQPSSTTSCAIDLASGRIAHVARNQIIKTRNSMSRNFIAVASESRRAERKTVIQQNVFISHRKSLSIGVRNYSRYPVLMTDNAFENVTLRRIGIGSERNTRDAQKALHHGLHGPDLDDDEDG